MSEENMRRFVPPLGWPLKFRVAIVTPAHRPRLLHLNRYPRQVIGIGIRLPDNHRDPWGRRLSLSIVWAKPARWWR